MGAKNHKELYKCCISIHILPRFSDKSASQSYQSDNSKGKNIPKSTTLSL